MAFPHFHQLEAKDCGPTCLRIIAKHYGKLYPIADIKKFCTMTRIGVSFQDIINGAQKLGFDTLPAKLSLQKINEVPLPAILFWRQEHYVVLYKIVEKKRGVRYFISDPNFGNISLSQEMFTKHWISNDESGVALLMEPTDTFHEMQPPPTNRFESIARLSGLFIDIFRSNKQKSYLAFLLICIAMVSTWFYPALFKRVIDQGVLGKNMNIVFSLLITQLIIFCSQVISDSISSILLMQINFKVGIKFLTNYLYKLIRLPLKVFDAKVNSDLMLRMDDSDRIQSFLTHHTLEFILSFVNLSIFSIMLFYYNPYCFGIFAGMALLSVFWTILFLNRRRLLDYSRFAVSSETRNNIYELINEMPEIKINNAHKSKITQWEKLQTKLNKIGLQALFLNYYQLIGSNFFNRVKDIFITALCAYFVIHNKMTLGVMITIGFIIGQLNGPIENLINILRGTQDAKLSFERLDEIQKMDDENRFKNLCLSSSPKYEITIKNVTFKYEGNHNPLVLKDISMTIPVGKITAIVGSSGSGKTTLMKLLLAIYDPSDGGIFLDGTLLKEVDPDTWRTRCGVVMQDGFIYSGTFAQNIALAEETPDLAKVEYVSKIVCINDFIMSLPLGYHTQIGRSGVDLSGGQKQKILIARAIYREPKFIFLDEATSSLDANNEKKIIENLQNYFQGKTVLIIAHRLSTVKKADQIIVLENGHIVENGNHSCLTRQKGKYFELVKNQLELGD
jgi:ATP-binding cassette, subfamily B, bacterial